MDGVQFLDTHLLYKDQREKNDCEEMVLEVDILTIERPDLLQKNLRRGAHHARS